MTKIWGCKLYKTLKGKAGAADVVAIELPAKAISESNLCKARLIHYESSPFTSSSRARPRSSVHRGAICCLCDLCGGPLSAPLRKPPSVMAGVFVPT